MSSFGKAGSVPRCLIPLPQMSLALTLECSVTGVCLLKAPGDRSAAADARPP